MFQCGFCKKTSQPGETKTLIVTKTRTKVYPQRRIGERMGEQVLDQGGTGTEIVEETPACPACAQTRAPSTAFNKPRFKRDLDDAEEARDP
jgi:hypothetical protein